MKLGITRVRNEEIIIGSTLNMLKDHLDGVIVFDDASDDYTVDICRSDDFVLDVIENKEWSANPMVRELLETSQRNQLYQYALQYANPDWVLYFDADEHFYFDYIDWSSDWSYYFRLFDVYITPEDENKHFLDREWIGSEYRDIPMLFRAKHSVNFYNRIPRGIGQSMFGGTVKHFGKGISVDHWEETCDYYINHLHEIGREGESISEKWRQRKGKAVHTMNDYGRPLIKWSERYQEDKIYKL